MIVYVTGKTRVKGVQNKDVYFVGCVESDGYIYFNDSMSYRVPTPSTLTEANNINVNDVQIWYTVRNCWVRANYFTQLKVYGVDFEHIYNRISTLESKVATLEQKVATLESKVATLESKVSTLETKVATLESKVSTLESKVSTLESKVATLESKVSTLETKVYNLETTVADHEVRIVACEAQIQGLNNRLITAENNITNLQNRMTIAEGQINTNRINILDINTTLGNLPNLIGQSNTLENYLRNKFNTIDSNFQWCETNINALVPVVTGHSNRISALEGDYTSVNSALTALTNLVNTINNSLNIFIQDFNNYQITADRAINDLGHKALGEVDSYGYGNGGTLHYLMNKMVECANYINAHGGSMTVSARTIWTHWNDV